QILFELEEEIKKSDKQIKELIKSKEESENKLKNSKGQIDSLKEKLSSLQGDQKDLKEKREVLESNIYKLDVKKNEIEAGINHLKAIIDDMNVRANGNSDKLESLENEIKEKFKLINDKQKELEDEKTSKEAGINEINLLNERIEEFIQKRVETEKNSALIRNAEKDHQESKENLGRELTRLDEQKNILKRDYEKIISDMWEAYNITLSQAEEQAKNFEDYSEAKKELASIKLKIRQLGSINLEAIEEYEEVKERYDFLNNQVKDAKKSKNDLEKIIKSLTSSMKDMFIRSFNEINYNFKQIFVKLFDGGKAELSLDDREDVLESGINIEVQPPGKIIKNLSSLSGGEKAFVAIAIYFAIIKVRPSPFCVLDEIEAALDDINVNKFASYINNIDDDTQFIVITHRRGTMEQANVLYGVTMQEEGVSKLLKLTTSHDAKNMVPA
ncbi:MAG: chromosome segregation protein SMC, partial [Oscillospiraceae bacterium]|nr:chromosome segregation protein SMC [Oscillospiraceae bacterium]